MFARKVRAVATALVIGTAAIAVAGVVFSSPAVAAVRPSVGKPLQEAQALAAQGNYQGAMGKIRQAEAVGGLSAEEQKIVGQMRDYIAVKSGGSVGVTSAVSAQAKFDSDYRSGRYRDVIAGESMLRKYNALNAGNMVLIAQSYYQLGNYRECVNYANDHASAGVAILERGAQCAFKSGDDNLMRAAAEQLVTASPTPQHWNQLLNQTERTKGLTDPQTLDIYRLKYMTGTMKGADDYFTLAQLLIAARLPSEARAVVEKGMSLKLMVDQRAQRLYGLTKQNQAGDIANLGKTAAAAQKSPKGDDLVKLGEDYTGMGKFKEAIDAIQSGIGKGVKDYDNAQVRLAVAYYGAGQKAQALSALAKAKKSPNGSMIARLWTFYIRQH
jgi:tetratricopeptide (TPR) repeat protein